MEVLAGVAGYFFDCTRSSGACNLFICSVSVLGGRAYFRHGLFLCFMSCVVVSRLVSDYVRDAVIVVVSTVSGVVPTRKYIAFGRLVMDINTGT